MCGSERRVDSIGGIVALGLGLGLVPNAATFNPQRASLDDRRPDTGQHEWQKSDQFVRRVSHLNGPFVILQPSLPPYPTEHRPMKKRLDRSHELKDKAETRGTSLCCRSGKRNPGTARRKPLISHQLAVPIQLDA